MGTISTKDTRRISFDNTFAIIPVITVHKSIEDNTFAEIENIVDETENESILKNQTIETHGYNENDYWTRRLDHLKKEHNSINKIIESEYEKTIENTNQIFEPLKVNHDRIHKMKPCFEWRAKILQCYEDNPHQPLMCSAAVQAFSQCVKSCRIDD